MATDIFLCYRRAGAQTAKLFKRYLDSIQFPFQVWYSDNESHGNYKYDIPDLVGSAKCAVLFVDNNFTMNFLEEDLDEECITALEIVEIEKRIQKDPDFWLVIVTLNCDGFSLEAQKDMEELFRRNGVLTDKGVSNFSLSNKIRFDVDKQEEYELFEKIANSLANGGLLSREKYFGDFYFGNKRTCADIVVWDEENGIAPEDIVFDVSYDEIKLYNEIEKKRCKDLEIEQNNKMVSVTKFTCSLSDDEERKRVAIDYQVINYELFKKTLKIWNVAGLGINQKVGLYSVDTMYEVPNAMGMAFMVVTKDHKLLFTRRSPKRGIRPNECDVSIVEGLKLSVESEKYGNYTIDDVDEYVLNEIYRAYNEEVCFIGDGIKVKINGIVLDKEYGQWNLVGTIFTEDTSMDIIRKHPMRGDSYERIQMEFVSYIDKNGNRTMDGIRNMLTEFAKYTMWSMGYATLYGTLKDIGFSDTDIMRLTE